MTRLLDELQRLYFPAPWCGRVGAGNALPIQELSAAALAQGLAGEAPVQLALASGEGSVRGMVLRFTRRGDWPRVAELYQSLQEELELPAPAIAASADDGYLLWLSLVEATPVPVARNFLAALCTRYLADLPPAAIAMLPGAGSESGLVGLVPALHGANGKWSAFIDPGMGSMFIDESGLDMAPNLERQAEMLAGLRSISPAALQRAQHLLAAAVAPVPAAAASNPPGSPASATLSATFTDAQSFLLAVINDPSVSLSQRIEAATALLPYTARKSAG
jgi:hypothetical protein